MKTGPDCTFGAAALQRHLAAVKQEVDGVRAAADIEHIHRMRVASRRLRATLPLFAKCFPKKLVRAWTRQMKGLTAALGAARDTDVQLELLHQVEAATGEARFKPGLRRLALRITQHRSQLQGDVVAALDKLEAAGFYTSLAAALAPFLNETGGSEPFSYTLYKAAAAAIQALLDDFLSYEAYIERPECALELHAMRIAAKKLRYTLEVFAPLYPPEFSSFQAAVKQSQELLGDIHDCDVWLEYLPGFIETERRLTLEYFGHARQFTRLLPGLTFFLENRRQFRADQHAEFIQRWARWREKDLWAQLRRQVCAPLQPGEIFPPAPAQASTEQPV